GFDTSHVFAGDGRFFDSVLLVIAHSISNSSPPMVGKKIADASNRNFALVVIDSHAAFQALRFFTWNDCAYSSGLAGLKVTPSNSVSGLLSRPPCFTPISFIAVS